MGITVGEVEVILTAKDNYSAEFARYAETVKNSTARVADLQTELSKLRDSLQGATQTGGTEAFTQVTDKIASLKKEIVDTNNNIGTHLAAMDRLRSSGSATSSVLTNELKAAFEGTTVSQRDEIRAQIDYSASLDANIVRIREQAAAIRSMNEAAAASGTGRTFPEATSAAAAAAGFGQRFGPAARDIDPAYVSSAPGTRQAVADAMASGTSNPIDDRIAEIAEIGRANRRAAAGSSGGGGTGSGGPYGSAVGGFFMDRITGDAVKPLTDEQAKWIEQLDKIGALNVANAARIGVAAVQVTAYKDAVKAAKEEESKGQPFMDSLLKQAVPLTEVQRTWLDQLNAMGILTQSNAAKVGVAAAQFKTYKDEMEGTASVAEKAGQSMDQVGMMAVRLTERLLILYALRGSFQFVVGLYQAADAMVNLHNQTQLSLEILQELQYSGKQTDVPFATINTAIDTLGKNLAQTKATAGDALLDIGLSFEKVFAMNPDQRITAIFQAIANLPDPFARKKAEVALFGTDIIDPVIEGWNKLSKAAKESGAVMEDGTINSLANTARAYKSWGETLTGVFQTIIVGWSDMWAKIAAPAFGASPSSIKSSALDQIDEFVANSPFGKVMGVLGAQNVHPVKTWDALWDYINGGTEGQLSNVPFVGPIQEKPRAGEAEQPHPPTGQAAIDSWKASAPPLTSAQRSQLEQLDKMNLLDMQHAIQGTSPQISTEQFKAYQEELKGTHAAQTKLNAETKKWNDIMAEADSVGGSWRKTLAGINGDIVEASKWYLAGGMTPGKVGTMYGLTDVEIKSIQASMKDEVETLKATAKSVDEATNTHAIAIEKLVTTYQVANGRIVSIFGPGQQALSMFGLPMFDPLTGAMQFSGGGTDTIPGARPLFGNQPVGTMGSRSATPNLDLHPDWTDGFKDVLDNAPHILEQAFIKGGGIDQAVKALAVRIGADFVEHIGIGAGAYVPQFDEHGNYTGLAPAGAGGAKRAIIGAGIVSGVGIAASGGSAVSQFGQAASLGLGVGTSVAASTGEVGAGIAAGAATAGIAAGVIAGVLLYKHLTRDQLPEEVASVSHGQGWSQGLQNTIVNAASDVRGQLDAQRRGASPETLIQAGITTSLPQIMAENPASQANIEAYTGHLRDVFELIRQGVLTTAQGTKVLNDAFPQMAVAGTDALGRISDGLREVISLNDILGTQSTSIADWRKAQGMDILSGAGAVIATLPMEELDRVGKNVEDATKARNDYFNEQQKKDPKFKSDAQLVKLDVTLAAAKADQAKDRSIAAGDVEDMGFFAKGGFIDAVATGTSKADALKAESASLTMLQKAYKDLGIVVTDEGLKRLFIQNEMLTQSPALIAGVEGLTKEMVGQINLDVETEASFNSQEEAGKKMYTRLQEAAFKAGGTTRDALEPMQGFLHAAADEAVKLNIPMDQTIQNMIKDSKELGIWDDKAGKAKDPTEKLADAIEKLVKWLDQMPDNVRTDVVVTTTYIDDYGQTQTGTRPPGPTPIPTIPPGPGPSRGTGEPTPQTPPGPGKPPTKPSDEPRVPELSTGGIVDDQYFDVGGQPRGTDTVRAWLTPKEGIVNVAGMGRIGPSGLAAINSGAPIGGDSHDSYNISFTVVTQANNAAKLAKEMKEPGGVIDILIDEISRNKRGRGTRLKRGIEAS